MDDGFCGLKIPFCGLKYLFCAPDFPGWTQHFPFCGHHFSRKTLQVALCEAAHGIGSAAVDATSSKEQITAEETKEKKALVALLREFQACARQKHFTKIIMCLASCSLESLPMWIQFAADAEWLHTRPLQPPHPP